MSLARDLLAAVLVVLGAVGLALWAPSAWTQSTIVDRDGFLAVAEPLGGNEQFQQDVADAAVEGVLDQVDVPRFLRSPLETAIEGQAQKLTQSTAFATIWADSMDDLHATLMDPDGGTVVADLNPYVDELAAPIGETIGVDIDIPDTDVLHLTIITIPASAWPGRITAFGGLSSWIGWASLGAAALGLVLASRRGTIGIVLGVATLLAGAVLMLATQGVSALVPDSIENARILGTLVGAFEKRLAVDMFVPAIAQIGAGALVIVVSAVAVGVASSRRRDTTAR